MRKRLWLFSIPAVMLVVMIGFMVWASGTLGPSTEALNALNSNSTVKVELSDSQIIFRPANGEAKTGLIFYPGGKVDYRSYSPVLRQVAAQGYFVVVPRMFLNLAVFGSDKATQEIVEHPEIQNWAIGGHSLGGSMAALYTYNHAEKIQGLVLWASYPANNNNLSDRRLQIVSISGSLDGLATSAKIDASRALLPKTTQWIEIMGGNHAQFGSYGLQPGDNTAAIPSEVQQEQAAAATIALLERIDKGPIQ